MNRLDKVGTYHIIITCRNSEDRIKDAIYSLKKQTIQPEYVVVIDDGSKDKTSEILKDIQKEWSKLYIITNPDLGYDIGRIVSNWNKAINLANELNFKKTDYHMLSTDDAIYEDHYVEKIIRYMEQNKNLVIVSGTYDDNTYVTPHGAGRLVRNSFFNKCGGTYPEKMGYESAILHMATQYGYTYEILNEARFEHTRELGTDHHFYEFGASMRTLGYNPVFVFGRFCVYFIKGKPIGRMGAIYMLYHYLKYKPKKEGYDSMYDKKFRDFIRSTQKGRMIRMIGKITGW